MDQKTDKIKPSRSPELHIDLFSSKCKSSIWFEKLRHNNKVISLQQEINSLTFRPWIEDLMEAVKEIVDQEQLNIIPKTRIRKSPVFDKLYFDSFSKLQTSEKFYYISIKDILLPAQTSLVMTPIVNFTVYNSLGQIVYFNQTHLWKKIALIRKFCTKINQNDTIFINDQTKQKGSHFTLIQLLTILSKTKMVYACKNNWRENQEQDQWKETNIEVVKKYYIKKQSLDSFFIFSKTLLKKLSEAFIMEKLNQFISIENQTEEYIKDQFSSLKDDENVDYCFFTLNFLRSHQQSNKQSYLQFLKESLVTFNEIQILKLENKEEHWAGGSTMKKYCNYCAQKRTEIICKGCLKIWGQEIYLCDGDCYYEHHQKIQLFSDESNFENFRSNQYKNMWSMMKFEKKISKMIEKTKRLVEIEKGIAMDSSEKPHSTQFLSYLNLSSMLCYNNAICKTNFDVN